MLRLLPFEDEALAAFLGHRLGKPKRWYSMIFPLPSSALSSLATGLGTCW